MNHVLVSLASPFYDLALHLCVGSLIIIIIIIINSFLEFLTVMVLPFVLSQCYIVKLLTKPILLRNLPTVSIITCIIVKVLVISAILTLIH